MLPRRTPGRHAGWSVAALIAPITAGAFAGVVTWADAHRPAPPQGTVSEQTSTPSPTGTVEQQLAAQTERVRVLRSEVRELRRQLGSATGGPGSPARTGTAAPPTTNASTSAS